MHLCECEHPKYIYNPYLGEDVRTSCGECDSCKNARAHSWVSRLLEEAQSHRFAVMISLTYDNDHLPRLFFDDTLENVVSDSAHELCMPLHDLTALCSTQKELDYLSNRLRHPLGLPFVCSEDISKFCKRLNKYIHDNYTHEYGNFRYFFCQEYGPATFRPHYHGALFSDCQQFVEHLQEAISACWPYGDSSSDPIYSVGGFQYVAQYVNMSCHLPAVYAHNALRPRSQFSKFPSIGSHLYLDEEIHDVYDRKPIVRSVYNSRTGENITLQQSRAFKDRFFPQCPRYSSWPLHDRITLYRAAQILPSHDFDEFRNSVNKLDWLASHNIGSEIENILWRYTSELKRNSKDDNAYIHSLYRLFLTSKKAIYLAHLLHYDIAHLVHHIDLYYKKVDYYNLKTMYAYEQEYSKFHPVSDLMFIYPTFVQELEFYNSKSFQRLTLPDHVLYAIDSFGLDMLSPPKLEHTYDYRVMSATSQKIYKDTHKSSDISNYRHSDTLRRLDLQLQQILCAYES